MKKESINVSKSILLLITCILVLILLSVPGFSSQTILKTGSNNVSLKNEINRTMKMGFNFLKEHQNPDGSWSQPGFPALTGLVTYAFLTSQPYHNLKQKPEFIKKALDFIISNVHENGAIYKEGLPNYNTSICMMALAAANDTKYHPYILKARRYVASLQMDQGKKGVADRVYDGGIGYGSKDHSDMSNTYMALEAMKMTKFLESDDTYKAFKDMQGLSKKTLDWDAALKFIQRCQNLPGYNDQAWSSADDKNRGGFIYFPGNSKAGEEKLPDGKVALRSYGSMTYAGLLSFIFADLKKDDPRVKAAYGWLKRNYTLDENPGVGQQGLFYYYHTMAKALTLYGENTLTQGDGRVVNWREQMAVNFVNRQKKDGSWINDAGRWWENDPTLVTSYVLISLNMIVPQL